MKKEVVGIAVSLLALVLAGTAAAQECENNAQGSGYSEMKMPFFGDLHAHTSWSFDAVTLGTRTTPAEAFEFAKGEEIGLPPYNRRGDPGRTKQLERPLDFLGLREDLSPHR